MDDATDPREAAASPRCVGRQTSRRRTNRGADQAGPCEPAIDPRQRKSLLCIEDDNEIAALLQEELTERGYDVNLASNGREGFASILAARPDLVLCDINMPLMTGFEVLERLTALGPRFCDMPFVFLTALDDRENELIGRKLGAADYVAKPIDFDILDERISDLLTRVESHHSDVELSPHEIEGLTWLAGGKTSDFRPPPNDPR